MHESILIMSRVFIKQSVFIPCVGISLLQDCVFSILKVVHGSWVEVFVRSASFLYDNVDTSEHRYR